MDSIDVIARKAESLRERYAKRDEDNRRLKLLRTGEWEKLAPGSFTDDYPAPMVANRIDIMARDTAASLAPLPSINCAVAISARDKAKSFADKRTKIANNYIQTSKLRAHQNDLGDSYGYFGLAVYYVKPDLDNKMPTIEVHSGADVYPVWDSRGDTAEVLECSEIDRSQLSVLYEGLEQRIEDENNNSGRRVFKIYTFADRTGVVSYLPEVGNYVLSQVPTNIPNRCPYVAVPRPTGMGDSFKSVPRSAYIDLIYPQLARNEMMMLNLDATYKSVNAPTVVTPDVTSVPIGPDAVIHAQGGITSVGKLNIQVPPSSNTAMDWLDRDLAIGGMSPEARTGQIQASVITGKGIEAASAGYSAQIADAQNMIAFGLELVLERCFAMDEFLWPDTKKTIRGTSNGTPYTDTYTPRKDIAGDYTVSVDYGFLLGMAPNNALVFLLQAAAGGYLSTDTATRNLPIGLDVVEEQQKIQLEKMRAGLLNGVAALSQVLAQAAAQGQDASTVVLQVADVTRRLQKGEQIEDIITEVFAPKPPPAAPAQAGSPQDAAAAGSAAAGGTPDAVRQMQKGAQPIPGDRPDLATMFAGMSGNGSAVLQGGVSTMNPAVGR